MQCVLHLLFLPYCPSSCILGMWLSDIAIYPAGQTRNIRFGWPVLFLDSPQSLATLCQSYLGSISPTSRCLSLSDTLHQGSWDIVPAFKEASKLLCLHLPLLHSIATLPSKFITQNQCASFSFNVRRWGGSGDGWWCCAQEYEGM